MLPYLALTNFDHEACESFSELSLKAYTGGPGCLHSQTSDAGSSPASEREDPSSFPISSMLLLAANRPTTLKDIPKDLLLIIFADFDFFRLQRLGTVSKHFQKILLSIMQALHGIKCNEEVYFYYYTILSKFAVIETRAYREHGKYKARMVLEGSPEYAGIKAALRTEFGACIRYHHGWESEFSSELSLLEMLYNGRKTSALPYLLDERPHASEWTGCIQELFERGRFDLLNQLKFPHIREWHFYSLLSIALPTTVVMAAARSLQRNEPATDLAKMVAHVILQDKDAGVPEGPVDLFILQYMHESHMAIPQNWVFKNGLLKQSISFWMYLMGQEAGEVEALLDIILECGDSDTKRLASVFYRMVSCDAIPADDTDVFQAMLIRFHFSPHSNEYVRANYVSMIGSRLWISHASIHALLDCGQSELIASSIVHPYLSSDVLKGLVAKMCRLCDKNLSRLVHCFLKFYSKSEYHFKTLLKEGADDQYTQLVWDWIQSNGRFDTIESSCCRVAVHSLRRLMFEKSISVAAAEKMLSEMQGYQIKENSISREAAIFYVVMYWEAPEEVVIHFLGQLTPNCKLDTKFVCDLSRSTKYSIEFWGQLVKCGGLSADNLKAHFECYRPDLLSLFN